jgi:hypothetical protein
MVGTVLGYGLARGICDRSWKRYYLKIEFRHGFS